MFYPNLLKLKLTKQKCKIKQISVTTAPEVFFILNVKREAFRMLFFFLVIKGYHSPIICLPSPYQLLTNSYHSR